MDEPDMLAAAILTLTRIPAAGQRAYLADLRKRAVDAGRFDVYAFAAQTLERLDLSEVQT